jgi:lipopolysaccharide heptosyltransferase I
VSPRRILIIKPSALGDVIHGLPVLRLLRRRWPDAHIAWLVRPQFAGILEGHPDLNRLHLFRREKLASVPKLVRELRRERFDLTVDLQGLFRTAWFGWMTGARHRAGFASAREGARGFYTITAGVRTADGHAVDRNLALAARLGCDGEAEFDFALTATDHAAADALLPNEPFAVLLPGTNWATKRWPVAHFAELAQRLEAERSLQVVVCGADRDGELARQIPGLDLTGRTPLKTLAAVLNRAALVVANDSGPMHLAAALSVPLLTPFGPTDPRRTGPYRRPETVVRLPLPCTPCFSRHCTHTTCLHALPPGALLDRVTRPLIAGVAKTPTAS